MTQPGGRTLAELRAIIKHDAERFAVLSRLWDALTEAAQDELIDFALKRVHDLDVADAFTPPDPFSRKA